MYYAPRRVPQPSSSGFALLLIGTAFLLLSSGDIFAGASSLTSSSSSSNYESVRSLDEYGNAVQIQHAQAAADQRGRLVLALHHNEHVWIVSPARPAVSTAHHLRQPASCGLLQPVTTAPLKTVADMEPTSPTTTTTTAAVYLCCTGVQADAHALLQHVRRYAAHVAERYNNHAPQSLAYAVAQFHRQFWGYNPEGTWTTTVANLQQQQQQPSWGRPLGVRSLVVTCGRPNGGSGVQIQLVEPSGLIREREQGAVWILGPQSELVWQALAKQPPPQQRDDVPEEDTLKRVLWQAFRQVIVDNDKKDAADSMELILEIVSPTGEIRREILTRDVLANTTTDLEVKPNTSASL